MSLDGSAVTDALADDRWRSLAGVGIGYGLACALIFVLFFLLPYAMLAAL
ncbi:hypothetical protein JCM17823_13110 [Halorubrum gandharaense]